MPTKILDIADMPAYTVITFYKFVDFPECQAFQPRLKKFMQDYDIKGTVLVTPEGVNGTVSGRPKNVAALQAFLAEDSRFADLTYKYSYTDEHVFERTKVKYKQEIIKIGHPVDPTSKVGTYVKPEDWNELLDDPDVVLIDTRNDYEVYLGTFEGAINPKTENFMELPEFLDKHLDPKTHKKVAMFCTGGVRCEKSTAYLLERGFEGVYHLEGGILKYLEDVDPAKSKWHGSCYVFDERVSLTHELEPSGETSICPACGHSLYTKDRRKPEYIHGVQCPFCAEKKVEELGRGVVTSL